MQTAAAHGSHAAVSAAPAVQGECAHVPPLDVLVALVVLVLVVAAVVELVLDILAPQGLVTGTQTLTLWPSAELATVHAVPEGHVTPVEQSIAQYVSPANCAQSEPAPQPAVSRQGTHWPAPPPELLVAGAPEAVVAPPMPAAVLVPEALPVPMNVVVETGPAAPTPAVAPEESPPSPPLMLVPLVAQDAAAVAERETHSNGTRRSPEKQLRIARHARVTILKPQGKEQPTMGHD
jgi:hypothetical protein